MTRDWYFLTLGDLLLLRLKLIGIVELGDLFFALMFIVFGSLAEGIGEAFLLALDLL